MQRLVGIFREDGDLGDALAELAILRSRSESMRRRRTGLQPRLEPRLRAAQPADHLGGRDPQRPAPHESRGAHSRLDFPATDDKQWGTVNCVVRVAPMARWTSGRHHWPRCRTSCVRSWASTEEDRWRTRTSGSSAAALANQAITTSSTSPPKRAWSSSTPFTGSRGTRHPTSPSAGIARPPSAAPAAPRSTAARA